MPKNAVTTKEVSALLGISEGYARRIVPSIKAKDDDGVTRRGYNLADLPPEVQAEWARREKIIPVSPTSPSPGQLGLSLVMPAGLNMDPKDAAEAQRRYTIIEPLVRPAAFRNLWLENKNSKLALIQYLARHNDTKQRTIYNWLKAFKIGGIKALIQKDRKDKGQPRVMTPSALEFLLAAAFPKHGAYGQLTIRDIFRAYEEERHWRVANTGQPLGDFELRKYHRYVDEAGCLLATAQLPIASYSSFRNWFNRIPEIAKVMAREGDEAFHNSQEIISFRNLTEVDPLDYLVMDHRRLDIFCLVPERVSGKPTWKLARPWLTAAIDMRTRKWMAWCIVETPSSDSIATVLKRAFLEFGLPQACYWDNGKDFRCEWLEGGQARQSTTRVDDLPALFRGVLQTLGVRVHHAVVKRARSKIIEPNFGRTADFDRTLPWWCGHNPTARPAERFDRLLAQHERWMAGETGVEAPFPTIAEVAAIYNDQMQHLNDRPLEGEGMNKVTPHGRGWLSPNEAWERFSPRVAKRTVPEDVIHIAFAKRRQLTIRHGEVQTTFGGRLYHYRLIGQPGRLMAFNGQEVDFAYDPLDLQTAAIYYQSRLIGLANCVELRRMGEDAFIEDEKLRRVARRETKRFIEAIHAQVHVPTHAERTARREVIAQSQPPRPEPARLEVPALLPEAVMEAAVAHREAVAPPAPIAVEKVAAVVPVAGDEFDFFNP